MVDYQRNRATIPRVGLIGCGQIGSLWDEGSANGQTWTHASAYQVSGLVDLVAIADNDRKRLLDCANARGIDRFYTDFRKMLRNEKLDILSICTPAAQRYVIFQIALEQGIRYFYCEKPIASTLEEALRLQALLQQYADAQVMVNYLRRWDPGFRKLKTLIEHGDLGTIQRITANYGKGIINNGTHLIDLLCWFFGKPCRVEILRVIDDALEQDTTMDLVLWFNYQQQEFPVYLLGTDHRQYSVFEIDILAEKARVSCVNNQAIQYNSVTENPIFPGYFQLQASETMAIDLAHSMLFAVQELVAAFLGQGKGSGMSCHFSDAIRALEVADWAHTESKHKNQ